MIDTHAHLDFPEFDGDREEVIQRFFSQGGKAIINIGVDLERSQRAIELAEKHNGIYASVGLHPEWFSKHETQNKKQVSEELKELAKNKKVVAIGETGLDYFHVARSMQHIAQKDLGKIKENQKAGFLAQIEIAKELDLPVVVHCRDAWNDLYGIVSRYEFRAVRFVLHCYSGAKSDTEKFLKLPNIYFSFSGNITYPKPAHRAENLADAVRIVPLDKIMLDSDAPFLAPQSRRGKRNEPIYISDITHKIALLKGVSEESVEDNTDENAFRFFWNKNSLE